MKLSGDDVCIMYVGVYPRESDAKERVKNRNWDIHKHIKLIICFLWMDKERDSDRQTDS